MGHDYRRADNGEFEVDEKLVNELLAKRLHARLARDFVVADNIRGRSRGTNPKPKPKPNLSLSLSLTSA